MARWKLTEPHYLNVPGTKWEMTLTDRATGRPKRQTFDVPLFLHPDSPGDWNYQGNRNDDGEIIVCHEGKGLPKDIIFLGNPTPGMLPLDDEARAITAGFSKIWEPTQGTDDQSQTNSYSQKLLLGLIDQMSAAQVSATAAPMAPGFEKLMETMMAMMAQQTQILAAIGGKLADVEFAKAGKALGEETVVDEAEPLEEIEPSREEIADAATAAREKEADSTTRARAHALSGRR